MKFLDLFAGIGGFRLGMESAGHECVGFCEIDKFARASYKAIHDTSEEVEMHDITKVPDEFIRGIGSIDVICGGFPCQAFSIAGKRRGFEDTRGTLFFEIARFASILRPRYLFLENVKGLLNHERGATFETILGTLDDLGYDVEWQVLNSKDYVPQNRERVFIIGHLRGESTRKVFPFEKESGGANTQQNKIEIAGNMNPKGFRQVNEVIDPKGICTTLRTFQGGGLEPKILVKESTKKGYTEAKPGDSVNISRPESKTRRGRVGKGIANTLLTGEEQAVILDNYRIRKLTPRECWRLQGFPDWAFDRAQKINSNSQLYKQAGNSVTVPVIADIARRL